MNRKDFFHKGTNSSAPVLVKLQSDGKPEDLLTAGYVSTPKVGYSANIEFVDSASAVSNRLAGAHFFFGSPDSKYGLPINTQFSAPLMIANTGSAPTNVTVSVDYTIGSSVQQADIGTFPLAVGEAKRLDLAEKLAKQGFQDRRQMRA